MADLRLRVPAVAAELWWLRQAVTEWASDLPAHATGRNTLIRPNDLCSTGTPAY